MPSVNDTSIKAAAQSVKAYIDDQKRKELLRFITCGSVDDGKSTLIGRLLYESKLLFEDQMENLKNISKKMGTQGDDIDYALLVDGLAAEREQGITIDVAYRFFNTEKRKFIVIDTPGHEQYTRNMATGASQASLAVLMVDARQGLTTQTKRHSYIVHSLGIRNIVVAINKMDLVEYGQARFEELVEDYREFAAQIGLTEFTAIPMSALKGDNVVDASPKMKWYKGPSLVEHLHAVPGEGNQDDSAFRMPVQWVNRPDLDFRGYAGRITSGQIKVGDTIRVMPSGKTSKLARISTFDGDLKTAASGQSVTLCLEDEVDVSRGDTLINDAQTAPDLGDRFVVKLLWMAEGNLKIGTTYRLKLGTQTMNASVTRINHVIDMNTLQELKSDGLELNEIAQCVVRTERPICYETYEASRDMGGFILVDKFSNATVALGLIDGVQTGLDVDQRTQELTIDRDARSVQKNQKPVTIWFTGIKRGGKTLVADSLERKLYERGHHSFILDSGNILKGMSEDLDSTQSNLIENTRRVAHIAKLMNEAGLIVMSCFTSALTSERRMARGIIGEEHFIEVHMDTPIEISRAQDKQGFYDKAERGEIRNVAGIDMRYEEPKAADLTFSFQRHSADEAAEAILQLLAERGII